MSDGTSRQPVTELLANVLNYGTWFASAIIGAGLVLPSFRLSAGPTDFTNHPGPPLVTVGIALFILLPVLRVALMLVAFLRERDYRFGAIAALVLAILFLGCALGAR